MAAIGKLAWFAFMNQKTPTAEPRSPEQTRPSRERGYRAAASAAGSHAAAGRVHRARPLSGRGRQAGALHHAVLRCGRPRPPRCGWPMRRARTREPNRSNHGLRGPTRPSVGGTRRGMGGGSWASDKHLTRKRSRCPPNRGNSKRVRRRMVVNHITIQRDQAA